MHHLELKDSLLLIFPPHRLPIASPPAQIGGQAFQGRLFVSGPAKQEK